ncbi:MAG: caspase family protein [Pyrinomonadaceae bacterium]|nr:caspase family protein [Pyrinomonadaceae bacterium]
MKILRLLLILLLICFSFSLANAQKTWNPQKTWVFFAGLLEWKDSDSLPSFPQKNRRDKILFDLLKQSGVPANQMVYLQDSQATTAKIQSEFIKILQKAKPDDWIFVYYCGHGFKDEKANAFLASFDVGGKTPGWAVKSVPETIEKYFKGSTAIIALDNCYSGSMADAVKSQRRRVSYAVLASSMASQASTGNWTFTEALISAFRGENFIDDDHNGVITFAELKSNTEDDMLFGEEQMATIEFTGNFDAKTVIAKAEPASNSPRMGERVEVNSANEWWRGYINDVQNNKFKVHYYGWEDTDDEWVTAKQMRQPKITQYRVGEKVEVEWQKKWYPAKVLEVKGGSHFITYEGYGSEWNEWVTSKRIRKVK